MRMVEDVGYKMEDVCVRSQDDGEGEAALFTAAYRAFLRARGWSEKLRLAAATRLEAGGDIFLAGKPASPAR